ncbi:DUF1932 domain-containing protein [Saccharopolyspora gregorii]|uniref:Putative 4-hydroxy-4-methyl-2-oxoglutarate aldolase n=1 Tax=Saccharopolyspora gregorii TaxID=33914 RepID=A0ABP6RR47_9PSEU
MRAAVVGLGEAGAAYATGLIAHGWTVSGYDPADGPTPPGVHRSDTLETALHGADLVLSLVGGAAATAAAAGAAPHLAADAVYADLNSAAPEVKRDVAAAVGEHRFADVAVTGSVPAHGAATGVVLSGAGSGPAARIFAELGADVEDIGGEPGDAAVRKLLRSTFMKGLGALVVEALDGARAAGAQDWVREQIARTLHGGADTVDRLHDGTRKHAGRRAAEAAAAAALLDSLGERGTLTRAAAEVHRALHDAALAPSDDLLADYAGLAVANIGDARDRMGMLDGGIRPLWRGARAVGRARTAWVRNGDNLGLVRALEGARPGDMLVINGGGDLSRALMGELIAERAQARGVVGMVIDGAARDVAELERIGFGVWARGSTPAGPYRQGPGTIDVPVAVGGVVARPGDLVAADDDGVIVVPAAEAATSLLGGREVEADEGRRRAAIRSGVTR